MAKVCLKALTFSSCPRFKMSDLDFLWLEEPSFWHSLISPKVPFLIVRYNRLYHYFNFKNHLSSCWSITIRASPIHEAFCGSQKCHISIRFLFLPLTFHHSPNPWHIILISPNAWDILRISKVPHQHKIHIFASYIPSFSDLDFLWLEEPSFWHSLISPKVPFLIVRYNRLYHYFNFKNHLSSCWSITIRASPMHEAFCGSQRCHISIRFIFLPLTFHHSPNPWHMQVDLSNKIFFIEPT